MTSASRSILASSESSAIDSARRLLSQSERYADSAARAQTTATAFFLASLVTASIASVTTGLVVANHRGRLWLLSGVLLLIGASFYSWLVFRRARRTAASFLSSADKLVAVLRESVPIAEDIDDWHYVEHLEITNRLSRFRL